MHGIHSRDGILATEKYQGAGTKVGWKEEPGSCCGGEIR